MSPITTKEEFKTSSQILEKERERLGITKPEAAVVVSPEPLLGTWVNVNHETRDLVRVVIATKGKEIVVHAFGACQPNPCDWGQVEGMIYAGSVVTSPAIGFVADYKFAFAEVRMVGHLMYGALVVETFTHFINQSGRADYFALDILGK